MHRKLINELNEWKSKPDRKPLILLGARQIGKTYLLQEFGRKYFNNCVYLNFERMHEIKSLFEKDLNPQKIIKEIGINLKTNIDIKTDLVIFDEIQDCPRAVTSLKYFCEEMPELALCAAGSLLGVKLGESSFPVGKVTFLNMHPMSFYEFLYAVEEDQLAKYIEEWQVQDHLPEAIHTQIWDLLKIYFVVGGLPEAILTYIKYKDNLLEALTKVRETQYDLVKTHQADIAKHSGKQNSMHIERIWSNIPNQLAKEHDGTSSKFKFSGVIPKVNGYSRLANSIDWLEAAGLIIKIPICNSGQMPLQAYTSENVFKLLIYDVGILGMLGNLDPTTILSYDYGTYKGYFAENFVAQEFICSMNKIEKLYSWKEAQSEVEFLRVDKNKVIPIEVKSGANTRAKSIRIFMNKYNSPCRIVLSALNVNIQKEKKLYKYPMYLAAKFHDLI